MRALVLAAGLLLTATMPVAEAAVPAHIGRKVSLVAREQPVAAFMQDLFSQIDTPVSVSNNVSGMVNGRFQGSVDSVFREAARTYSLVWYFDGAVMHIYPAAEIGTRTYSTDANQAAKLLRTAEELALPDGRNSLRVTRSGTLVAVGTPRFLQQLDDLVRAESGAGQPVAAEAPRTAAGPSIGFRVFYLRHAWAQDTRVAFGGKQLVVPGVASILRNVTAGLGQTVAQPWLPGMAMPSANAGVDTGDLVRPTQPRLRGQGLGGIGRSPVLGADNDETREAAAERAAAANAQQGAAQAAANAGYGAGVPPRYVFTNVGGARVEADPRSNAVIVRDVTERLPMYERLVAALDFEPQMVEVEATIVDVNITRLEQLGINWRWINGRNDVLFGNGTQSDTLLSNGGAQITPSARGGVISTVLGSGANFISRINALAADGAARVVSRPQLITLSNVEALFDNSSTFYVRVAGRNEVDLFNVSSGTSLRVTPNVFRDRDDWRIKLLVSVEDGSISPQQVDQIPVVDRSSINTQALIQEGESLLIGGMTREASNRGVDKVPGLGDVPVIGNLFKSRSESTSRLERLVLLTPRLVGAGRAGGQNRGALLPVPAGQPLPLQEQVVPATPAPSAALPAVQPQQVLPSQVLPTQVVPMQVPPTQFAPAQYMPAPAQPAAVQRAVPQAAPVADAPAPATTVAAPYVHVWRPRAAGSAAAERDACLRRGDQGC